MSNRVHPKPRPEAGRDSLALDQEAFLLAFGSCPRCNATVQVDYIGAMPGVIVIHEDDCPAGCSGCAPPTPTS